MRRLRPAIIVGYLLIVIATAGWAIAAGRRPYAPFSLLPQPQPITVTVVYSTELQSWLTQAAATFEANNAIRGAPIDIVLQGQDSASAKDALREGSLRSTVWIPSDTLWLDTLSHEISQQGKQPLVSTAGGDMPQSVANTPLVIATWADHASILGAGGQSVWRHLHDLAVAPDGWGSLGHPEWNTLKWGQTSPDMSNSGFITLLLMTYDFRNIQSGLTIAQAEDQELRSWLQPLKHATTFGDSSNTLINDMLAYGPSRFDAIATYENLLIEYLPNAARRGQQLQAIYPPANKMSDHPYALLNGDWITADQHLAARAFRDFLLSKPVQEQARQLGLRPVRSDVPINTADSPFARNATAGVRQDLPKLVETPRAEVAQMLLTTWGQVSTQ